MEERDGEEKDRRHLEMEGRDWREVDGRG